MRTLTIGSTILELNSFDKRWDKIGGVYAEIKIPTSAIAYDDLEALFDGNAEDLIVTEEDGSTATYSGYSETHKLIKNLITGMYEVTQYCTSTAMHLLNEARKQIATLETEKAELQSKVNAQGATITAQAEQVASLEETSAAHLTAIDSILTEVVPSIIELSVAQAIEAVLAAQKETTE